MSRFLKIFPAAMVAALLVIAAACGGGGGTPSDAQSSSQDGGTQQQDGPGGSAQGGASSGALVSDAIEALGKSAENMQSDVQSVAADFSLDMDAGAMSMVASGEFRFKAPGDMYMTMKMGGGGGTLDLGDLGNIEMLVVGDSIYINTAFTGWIEMSLADMGADADTFKQMMDGHSPFDYSKLVEDAGGQIEDLGTETIDGKEYAHFRVTIDMADIIGAFSDVLDSTGGAVTADAMPASLSGPITMDIWVEPVTLLPYKLAADGAFDMGGQSAKMALEFNFRQFNGSVEIPEPPADAQSLADMFSSFLPQDTGN